MKRFHVNPHQIMTQLIQLKRAGHMGSFGRQQRNMLLLLATMMLATKAQIASPVF
jgi:hypothetical protein